jgi:hypothetical protein
MMMYMASEATLPSTIEAINTAELAESKPRISLINLFGAGNVATLEELKAKLKKMLKPIYAC